MHLGALSILMGILSIFGVHLWIWLPVISSITITVHLLIMNCYFKSLMEGFLSKYAEQFDDPEELGMMKTSPGIFIPQVVLFSNFARTDLGASLGWVRILSIIAIVLGLIFRDYAISAIGVAIFLLYLFTNIGSIFYQNNPKGDMFGSVRRYLSKAKKNVKLMTDMEIELYASKYHKIVEKLRSISQ